MKIGTTKELKNHEYRVGLTPDNVMAYVAHGHTVYVQATAGVGSGYADEEYTAAGATILPTIEEVYAIADMIYKVKEPIAYEYPLIRKGQLLFTYFHFACEKELTEAMVKQGATCLAYETVVKDGVLPLLQPMSEVAGRMATQEGARFLEKPQGGKGMLLGGVPGVRAARVLVLGGGIVGYNAALMAAGMGANVTITDISLPRLRQLEYMLPKNVRTLYSSQYNIEQELPHTDLVIGSVLIPGAKAPHIITRDMLKLMQPGSVMVDVAIDQGGCFETSHPTTHSDPIFEVDGIVHYCVANIPGAVPMTSTCALGNATLPYAIRLANMGWKEACRADAGLAKGLNVVDGKICFKAVSEAFNMPYTPVEEILA